MDTHQRIDFYSRTISFCCIYAYHLSKTKYRTKLAMSSYAGQLNSSLSRKLLAIVGVSSIDMRYFNIFELYTMCNIYGELNRRFSYPRNSMQKSRLHLLYAYRLMYCCVWNAYSQWYFPINTAGDKRGKTNASMAYLKHIRKISLTVQIIGIFPFE